MCYFFGVIDLDYSPHSGDLIRFIVYLIIKAYPISYASVVLIQSGNGSSGSSSIVVISYGEYRQVGICSDFVIKGNFMVLTYTEINAYFLETN